MSRKRYRYILPDVDFNYDRPISQFDLLAKNVFSRFNELACCVRICIPDDLVLEKRTYDYYSRTDDPRTLNELGCDVMVKIDGKWVIRNDLKDARLDNLSTVLLRKERLLYTNGLGYVTKGRFQEHHKRKETQTRAALREGRLPDDRPNWYAVVWDNNDDIGYNMFQEECVAMDIYNYMCSNCNVTNLRLIRPADHTKSSKEE